MNQKVDGPERNPYYADEFVTIYNADCRDIMPIEADVLVTDPPYGIDYKSGQAIHGAASIQGDKDTSLRDWVIETWGDKPALLFGTWKIVRPEATRARLIWDSKGALGMGALDLPWKPADQEIYVLGRGFKGHRSNNVLRFAPVQAMTTNGRVHPHEKPVSLMQDLIAKCPPGIILDPFMGSGSTLRAAKNLGRRAIGIEIDKHYCDVAVRRMGQEVLAV